MKTSAFLIFFSIVLVVYLSVNFYIYNRGLQVLTISGSVRTLIKFSFWALVSSYILGRFLERIYLSVFTDILTWIGSFWLAAMLYFFLLVLVIDIVRLLNYIVPFFPNYFSSVSFKNIVLIASIAIVSVTVLAGYINAISPRVKKLTISINKQANQLKSVKAVLVTDVHMGTIIGPRRISKMVNLIGTIKPDVILFAGDVVDEDLEPVIRQNLGEMLKKLNAPMGIYAITGNHEYIGGVSKAVKYLEAHNIKFIRDDSVKIANSFYLIGREDRSKNSRGQRKDIAALLRGVDMQLPVIMMDHQPYDLDSVQQAGVDLQLSGHTHHGQLWPLNYITSAIYEVSQGYKKKGDSHFYVSNGFGSWGPPVRIGNIPEIVEININFKE